MYVPSTGKLIVGGILFLWGSAIVVNGLFGGDAGGDTAYSTGKTFAWIFGIAMVIAGGRQLWFEYSARR